MKRHLIYKLVLAFIIYSAAVLYITHPLIHNLDIFITGLGDELLIAWIQNWVLHSIVVNPFDIFNANIYYPYKNTFAYSETFITSSLFASIVKPFSSEPVAMVNFTLITSLLSLGLGIFLLSYYVSKDYLASLFTGLMVTFSPAVLSYTTHLQVLGIAGVPLAILFFLLFLERKQIRYFVLAAFMFLLQMYNSFLPGYFILFSWTIILAVYWWKDRKKVLLINRIKSISILLITCICILPILIPYFHVADEFKYARDIRESVHNAFQFEDFLYPGDTTKLKPLLLNTIPMNQYSQNDEFKTGYLGAIFTILSVTAVVYVLKFRRKNTKQLITFATIGVVSLVISLGPVLHLNRHTVHEPFLIPLPYALLYYILPGFQGFRTPVRWEMLFIIAFAVIIAILLHKLLSKIDYKKQICIYTILILGIIAEFNAPLSYERAPQIKDFPAVYSWLQTTPKDTAIIEMPIYTWDMHLYVMNENMREYYATQHFRKMVNGASGFSPQPWQSDAREALKSFPNDSVIQGFDKKGVEYIIVHKKEYDLLYKDKFIVNDKAVADGDTIVKSLNKSDRLQLIKTYDDDYVYRIIK
jgi:hypothetical protein